MDDKHRGILRSHRLELMKDLEVKKLLPYLANVLDQDDEDEVKAEAARRDMIDKLLDILPRKGPAAFDNFVKALKNIQPHLAASLIQESGKK